MKRILSIDGGGIRGIIPASTLVKPKNAGTTGKLGLIDCAVASAAAPTYFKPWTMQIGGKPTVLVDGGVGVTGNPVYQACVEAFYYDDFTLAETKVVSLGTGSFP